MEPQDLSTPLISDETNSEGNYNYSRLQIRKAQHCIRLGFALSLIVIITAAAFSIFVYYYHLNFDKKGQTTSNPVFEEPALNIDSPHFQG